MVDLKLDTHGRNDSIAMKFCLITTSSSIKSRRAVAFITLVSIHIAALVELISSNHFISFGIDLEETY